MSSPAPEQFDVLIVGAGAAGLATAIFTARRCPSLRIACLDGARKIGAKILVSGGGRCNLTNVRVTPEDFWGGSRNSIRRVLNAFDHLQTVEFFRGLGVPLHEEQWGKLFPDSNSAKTVLSALLAECDRLGVSVLAGHRVTAVALSDAGFQVTVALATNAGATRVFTAIAVGLATGGRSLPKTGSDGFGYDLAQSLGHSIIPTTPGLAPLVLEGDFYANLAGISHEAEIILAPNGQKPVKISGPMLWTHFGASGPAIMDASRHWHRAMLEGDRPRVDLNLLPGQDFPAAEQTLITAVSRQPNVAIRNILGALIPTRVGEVVLAGVGIPPSRPMGQVTREDRRRLVHALIDWHLPVIGSRGYNYAEVTAGGVALTEINPATMESRVCPGLFLVGEVLDVDGRIGGFNFQWAWSSGHAAAGGICRRLRPDAGDFKRDGPAVRN